MTRKVYAILVTARRLCIVDAESEREAQKIAILDAEFDAFHFEEASTDQSDISAAVIADHLREGAQDLREEL